jgi:hypothetical protein
MQCPSDGVASACKALTKNILLHLEQWFIQKTNIMGIFIYF